MPTIGTSRPAACRRAARILGRFAWIFATPPGKHCGSWHGKSFAPMSIVMNATWFLWARRNDTASSSCEPCRYEQMPPLIRVVVVSPGQPSLTSDSFGECWRAIASSCSA